MKNKEVYIDGVDVSKCSYFNFTNEHYCDECSSEFGCAVCDERTSCYYKQLKHKEQECEKYKQALDEIEELAKHNNFLVRDPFCGMGYRDLSGQILNSINKTKEYTNDR